MLPGPTFVLILFIALIAKPAQSSISYNAQCNYDATNGFSTRVVVETGPFDNIYQISALSSTNAVVADCTIPQIDYGLYVYDITVDTAGSSFIPTACGSAFQVIDIDSDGSIDEVTFTFLIQTTGNFVFSTDVVFQWKCTTADHNNVVMQSFAIDSIPVNNLGLKSQLALEVYDFTDDTKKTSGDQLTLGGSYYLKLKHTYANSQNKQVGIYVNQLIFYEGADSTSLPNVVAIDYGCTQTPSAYGLTQNFAKDAVSSTLPTNGGLAAGGTDGVYVIKSGTFETALWMKTTGISTNLNVEAVIRRCISDDQSLCDNYQNIICNNPDRRRRSAEDTGLQNVTSVRTSFKISLFGGSADQGSGHNDVKGSMETCYQTYTFWIVVLVFGILMLLCLIFAVYLFFRLRREKESRRKTEEKYGVINPSF